MEWIVYVTNGAMNTQEVDKLLNSYTRDFDPYFSTRVMARIQRETEELWSWKWLSPALGLAAICLAILWLQEGSLSVDGLLGVGGYDTELNDYLMYF